MNGAVVLSMHLALALILASSCTTTGDGELQAPVVFKILPPTKGCTPHPERLYFLKKSYGGKLKGREREQLKRLEVLAAFPDEYLNWLLLEKKNQDGLKVLARIPIEVGKGVFAYLQPVFADLSDDTEALFRAMPQSGADGADKADFFAEVFATYYCSEAARKKLRATLPGAYELAASHLIDPKKVLFGRTKDTPQGVAKVVDADRDGIPDAYDRCKETPLGQDVHKNGKRMGC